MAEAATPKRPSWFWPVVVVIVLVLVAGGFATPAVFECTASRDGFGTCMTGKLADLGVIPAPEKKADEQPTAVAVAQPADTATAPAASVAPPDFGVRVEPNGSIVIAGSGATGKTVQIFVNGELYGTAEVEPSGDWVLVPDAPLPPGGYEITLVDPETGTPLDKSFVVAINEDKTSEPLVVASTPGKASEILSGIGAAATAVAEAGTPETPAEPAASAESETPSEPMAVATAEDAGKAADAINEAVTPPEGAAELAATPPAVPQPADTAAAQPEAAPAEAVASAEPPKADEDVIGDVDALQKRIEALAASTPPTIEAVEIDNGKNYFAGTGADGAIVRVYVDNTFVGDAKVAEGRWLLETGDVLKNRSQRVRADQLAPGSAQVASRAEIDFIFEAPATAPAATAVAEAPVTVPEPDFGIDTDAPPTVPVEPQAAEPEPAATPAEPAAAPAETAVAEAPVTVPAPDFGIDTSTPPPVSRVSEPSPAETKVARATPSETAVSSEASGTAEAGSASSGTSTAVASSAGAVVSVPKPDFSVDTGIPVTVVPDTPADTMEMAKAEEPAATTPEPAATPPAETAAAPAAEPAAVAAAAPEVPQLVAKQVGPVELGRFATGKAIIRRGDNLWTIARRVYGSGYRYTQIYGANRDQIRNPDLIYPGQVFALPAASGTKTASN